MTIFLLCFFTFAITHVSTENIPPFKLGASGRYCSQGSMDLMNPSSGGNVDYDHYCGLHPFTPGACVSVTYSDNTVRMGCDNDDGMPECNHDSDYCNLYSNGEWICCCNEDHCNDCTTRPSDCYYDGVKPKPTTIPPPTVPTTVSTANLTCPNGTIASFSNSSICYMFQAKNDYFLTAEKSCNQYAGHLVTINEMLDDVFLAEQALESFTNNDASNFWIGLTNLLSQNAWEWLDGSPVVFTNWNATQPQSTTGSGCAAVIMAGGKWLTDDCFKMKPYVCSIKATVPSSKFKE